MKADAYSIETRVNDQRVNVTPMPDPFVNHTITLGGLRFAWLALLGRLRVTVVVDAPPETVERVMELDPDYLGGPGSPSRVAWNAQVQDALSALAIEGSEE